MDLMVKLWAWDILMWRDGRDEKEQRADCEPDVRRWLTAGTGLMTLATMHAKLRVCVCLCVRVCVCASVCVRRDFHLSSKTTSSTHAQYRLAKAHYFTLWPGHKTTQSVSYFLRVNGHLGNSLGWFEVWKTKLCEECPGTVDRNGASPSVVRLSDLFSLLFADF